MMATPAPAKSQPLHNFPLPSLWSKNRHRARRHHTAMGALRERRRTPPQWESRRINVSIPRPSDPTAQKKTPLPTPSDRKISIKIRGTGPPKREEREGKAEAEDDERERKRKAEGEERERKRKGEAEGDERERERKAEAEENDELAKTWNLRKRKGEVEGDERERERKAEAEENDELAKTWNLRPRKQRKTKQRNAGPLPENKTICAAAMPVAMEEGGDKREMKRGKFSLSLSKTEIEEDLFAMTGSRPNRRPKKRPRTVQKQLDDIFPGMWLESITPDSYKVNAAREKP